MNLWIQRAQQREELAHGLLQVAKKGMCLPIRDLTQMHAFDISMDTSACFGSTGPQQARAIANLRRMTKVFAKSIWL